MTFLQQPPRLKISMTLGYAACSDQTERHEEDRVKSAKEARPSLADFPTPLA